MLHREKDWLAAANVLLPPRWPRASPARQPPRPALGSWCLAQALKADAANAGLQLRYEAALREQLRRWPDAVESLKAEEFLSNWLAAQKRFDQLAAMWCASPQAHSRPM